jgi:tetratricopeptide (TPR) repeat protein
VDKALERTNRAARTAFDSGRIQQAANLYRQTLELAYVRDDPLAVNDARYNLALCLTLMDSDREALALVGQAHKELSQDNATVPSDILLLEATILFRLGRSQDAWRLSAEILKAVESTDPAVIGKTHFLRGLLATDRGDPVGIRREIESLANPNSAMQRADRQELNGHLLLIEQRADEAASAFDEAAAIRRQILDYRGMIQALAKAGEACERAGRPIPASRRYLRAGRSAALQGKSNQARIWLTRAAQLAERNSDESIAREARIQLTKLGEGQAVSTGAKTADPDGR